jgi:AraC-like DNA-binding protein
MLYNVFDPHPALKEFVNHIIVYDVTVSASTEPLVCSFPPLPENFLYIYVFEPPTVGFLSQNRTETMPDSVVIGQQTNRIRLTMPHHNVSVRVGFQPAGLYRLLGVPMHRYFLDKNIDTAEFFKDEIKEVREQLQEAVSYRHMVSIVEAFLLKKSRRLKPKLPIDHVLPSILYNGGLTKVEDIAHQSCVSFRQLERQFHQRVGVSPKFFLRLVRFAKAWMLRESNLNLSWTRIAHQCGYFDQMHFIRDFKEFAGVSPSVIEADINEATAFMKTGLKL